MEKIKEITKDDVKAYFDKAIEQDNSETINTNQNCWITVTEISNFVMEELSEKEKHETTIKELEHLNECLQNRCHALTGGVMCIFCPMSCKHKNTEVVDND